jgi:hypothetical protein
LKNKKKKKGLLGKTICIGVSMATILNQQVTDQENQRRAHGNTPTAAHISLLIFDKASGHRPQHTAQQSTPENTLTSLSLFLHQFKTTELLLVILVLMDCYTWQKVVFCCILEHCSALHNAENSFQMTIQFIQHPGGGGYCHQAWRLLSLGMAVV